MFEKSVCNDTGDVMWTCASPPPKKKLKKIHTTVSLSFLWFYFICIGGNDVALTEFEASPAGMIKSFTTRFPGNDSVLEDLWRAEMPYHKL